MAFLIVASAVLALVGYRLALEVWQDHLLRKLEPYLERERRNDAILWKAVFGSMDTLQCDGKDPLDPVSEDARQAAAARMQAAIDSGTVSFPAPARGITVIGCEPIGNDWHERRFVLRDSAGHRLEILATFLRSETDSGRTRLSGGEGAAPSFSAPGMAHPSPGERSVRESLRRAGVTP